MANAFTYPGVYFKETEFGAVSRAIDGVDMSIGGCVVIAEKGEIGVAVRCTSFDDYVSKFGGAIKDAYGYYAVKGFFENGGSMINVVRTAHYTNVEEPSTCQAKIATLDVQDDAEKTMTISAKTPGTYGNTIGIKIDKVNFVNTKTTGTANIGATSFTVESARNIEVGTILTVNEEMVTVVAVKGLTVTIDKGLKDSLSGKEVVKSTEFNLEVTLNANRVELFENLSMDVNSPRYFATMINENSSYINVVDASSSQQYPANYPANLAMTYLSKGADGLSEIATTDFIGSMAHRTGLYALDYVKTPMTVFIPESQDVAVNNAILTYCENRMDCFGVITVPEGLDVKGAEAYRLDKGNFNSSYGALYYNNGYVADPIGVGKNPEKLIPLDGHIAGVIARTQFSDAPAGEEAVLRGVTRLDRTLTDAEIGILNQISVNCITNFPGSGNLIWGTRTLASDPKFRYIHARRIFIYAEQSIANSTRWTVFKASEPTTWKAIVRSVTNFLSNMPGLYGETTEERFMVICDETINTEAVRKSGEIRTKIGLNVTDIGEFIVFEIGQMREGMTLSE